MQKQNIGVIFGGRSGEHEVSLASATSIIEALDKNLYHITEIGISKSGAWYVGENILNEFKKGSNFNTLPQYTISTHPEKTGLILQSDREDTKNSQKFYPIDIFFPIVHGTNGEDGTLQGMLDMVNATYVGSDVLGSAIGMDKVIQKQILSYEHIPIADFYHFTRQEYIDDVSSIIQNTEKKLTYPLFVKPSNMGSSVGISKVANRSELLLAIDKALIYSSKIIIEKGVPNAREIEFAILGNNELMISEPGEIIPSNEFYDYDAKYVDGKSKALIPTDIELATKELMKIDALKAYKALNTKGMARVDFLLEKGRNNYVLNEINTLPGFTSISMYPKLIQNSQISYSQLLDKLISLAIESSEKRKKLSVTHNTSKWYNEVYENDLVEK